MSTPVHDKKRQIDYLQQRLKLIQEMLDNVDPDQSDANDLIRLESMFDQIQIKINQFKKDWE